MKIAVAFLILLAATSAAAQQSRPLTDGQIMPLWSGRAPGALGSEEGDIPALTVYLPRTMTTATPAVVICPGGGFRFLSWQSEGTEVAEWL